MVALAGALGVFAALMTWTRAAPDYPGPEIIPVRLIDNGFHTDLAVPRAALIARGGPLAEGQTCRSLFDALLALEWQIPGGPGELADFRA